MASWKGLRTFSNDGNPPPPAIPKEIEQDARAFYQTLPEERKAQAKGDDSAFSYFEDGTGQHAVVIDASDSHEFWHYALIYDRNNRRIKVSNIFDRLEHRVLTPIASKKPNPALERTPTGRGGLVPLSTPFCGQ